jgi:hypothetical protein
MSGESQRHVRLVEVLIETINRRHANGRDLVIFADHPRFGTDRPAQIGGFTPDVFASDIPATFRVVGEAKTASDLESERSQRQLVAFLDHLALYPRSTLYLAVPWLIAPRAHGLIRMLRRPDHAAVHMEVLRCV